MIRPFEVLKIDSKRSLTDRSEARISGVFRIRAVRKEREHALIAVGGQRVQIESFPSIGVGSILKSPVWMIVPAES